MASLPYREHKTLNSTFWILSPNDSSVPQKENNEVSSKIEKYEEIKNI